MLGVGIQHDASLGNTEQTGWKQRGKGEEDKAISLTLGIGQRRVV